VHYILSRISRDDVLKVDVETPDPEHVGPEHVSDQTTDLRETS
jgi:hypothetical protein